ncbi:hypothetical protein RRG08_057620 [Elysia crispata]|uniref:Uncharacterized protein n=1 Tax=Elysia crispata TaxID=231223 RepID=A0AAE1DRR5_9GAST|nr:hypothetical protein RRG08_057620 [Elysia crispata]
MQKVIPEVSASQSAVVDVSRRGMRSCQGDSYPPVCPVSTTRSDQTPNSQTCSTPGKPHSKIITGDNAQALLTTSYHSNRSRHELEAFHHFCVLASELVI